MPAESVRLLANVGWVLVLLPAAVAVVQKGVVEREEAYLARRFLEAAYPAHKGRVCRWV